MLYSLKCAGARARLVDGSVRAHGTAHSFDRPARAAGAPRTSDRTRAAPPDRDTTHSFIPVHSTLCLLLFPFLFARSLMTLSFTLIRSPSISCLLCSFAIFNLLLPAHSITWNCSRNYSAKICLLYRKSYKNSSSGSALFYTNYLNLQIISSPGSISHLIPRSISFSMLLH